MSIITIADVAPSPDPVVFTPWPAHHFYGAGSFISSWFPPPFLTISSHALLLMLCCLRSIPFYCPSLWSVPSLVNSSAIISLPGRYCISTGMFCSSPSISLHSFGVITCSFVYANRGWWSTRNITFFPFRVQYRRFLAALAMVRNSLSNVVAFLSASLKSPPLNSSICSSPWWSTW